MRLISAEILKLRRRRGLMIWTGLMTVGSVVIAYSVLLALHLSAPHNHGPAGGLNNLQHMLWLLANLGGVAAILIGTTAGAQDVSAGVFRDLVVTGRSRKALFRARFPGALAVYLPMLATGFALAVAGAYAFAGSSVAPTLHDVVHYWIAVGSLAVVTLALGVGLGTIIPPRIATGVLVGWGAILAPLLIGISSLGSARKGIDVAAAMHFAPDLGKGGTIAMSAGTAAIVLAIWTVIGLRLGEFWTRRVDA
jgi:hypothetical protein